MSHTNRRLIETYLKIRANDKPKKEVADLTTELAFIFNEFPEAKEYFRARTDMFYQMSLGEKVKKVKKKLVLFLHYGIITSLLKNRQQQKRKRL